MSNRFPADDEHLHHYPGNLKHNKVSKEEQRKLLSEMMADDAKSGIYDTEKREPLLSDADLNEKFRVKHNEEYDGYAHGTAGFNTAAYVRGIYEAARAKDAELIQRLVDALHIATRYEHYKTFPERWHASIGEWNRAIDAAAAAGFKPTEP